MDDVRLHEALTGGDDDALAEVYDAHGRAVYGLALRITNDPATAEDIAQDVFVELWRRPERFDPGRARLRTWLCTIARRRAIDWLRRRGTQHHYQHLLAQPAAAPVDVAEDAVRATLIKQVRQVVDELPEIYRDVVLLAYYRGLSYRDVARALAIPEGTAKTRLRMGLRRIADAVSAASI
jgi:RNA polymerase sigma factor (sigma-70 family)